MWLSSRIADRILYEDERFVRSDDGEVAERALRIPGAAIGYCHDSGVVHLAKLFKDSTEPYPILMDMYEACDLLIRALPERSIGQNTIWRECLSRYGGPYLFGETPTLADAMYAPVTTRFTTYDVKLDRACADYCETIQSLPDMLEWMEDARNERTGIEELEAEF